MLPFPPAKQMDVLLNSPGGSHGSLETRLGVKQETWPGHKAQLRNMVENLEGGGGGRGRQDSQVEYSLVLKLGISGQKKSRQKPIFSAVSTISLPMVGSHFSKSQRFCTQDTQLFWLPLACWWERLMLHPHFSVSWNLFSAQLQNCQHEEGLVPICSSESSQRTEVLSEKREGQEA